MYCPDLAALGQWILDFKPLLKAGLAWYVPTYSILRTGGVLKGATHTEDRDFRAAVDFLVADGRAVDGSGADPIKSQFVRPILEIDLPFIEASTPGPSARSRSASSARTRPSATTCAAACWRWTTRSTRSSPSGR